MTNSAERFGPFFDELIATLPLASIDSGTPVESALLDASDFDLEKAFGNQTITDHKMASCCLSGIYLGLNRLDESHSISQDIDTPEGSYWHGIMHRREGDFSNSKYWFRRVGEHPIQRALTSAAEELRSLRQPKNPYGQLFESGLWSHNLFVDRCEKASQGTDEATEKFLRELAQHEWTQLFEHCYRHAIA